MLLHWNRPSFCSPAIAQYFPSKAIALQDRRSPYQSLTQLTRSAIALTHDDRALNFCSF
ncbi:hypothetical protein [Nostoc sp.]